MLSDTFLYHSKKNSRNDYSLSVAVTRCTIRFHLLSLVIGVPLVVSQCHSMYHHSSVFFNKQSVQNVIKLLCYEHWTGKCKFLTYFPSVLANVSFAKFNVSSLLYRTVPGNFIGCLNITWIEVHHLTFFITYDHVFRNKGLQRSSSAN